VKLAEAQKQELIVRYHKSSKPLFETVDDSLVEPEPDQGPARSNSVVKTAALREYARLAQIRFDEGYTSYLEVLDANPEPVLTPN